MQTRNQTIDYLRLFFIIGILFIHTGLCYALPYGYYILTIIFRLGIPFFFITSGYFYGKQDNGFDRNNLKNNYLKKLIPPYIFWGTLYLILEFLINQNKSLLFLVSNTFKMFLGSFSNVMWYSGSLSWSIIILSNIKNKKQLIISIVISFLLYLIGLLFNTYNFVLIFHYTELYDALISTFTQNRSFWFVGFMYVAIGYYIGKYFKCKIKKRNYIIILLLSLILLFFECNYIHTKLEWVYEYDYFIFQVPVVVCMFILLINKNKKNKFKNTKIVRNLSANMYYEHFLAIYVVTMFNRIFLSSSTWLTYGTISYSLVVLILTLMLSLLFIKVKNPILKKITS